jgi:hypothetical protein
MNHPIIKRFLLWLKKPPELKVKRMEWKAKDKSGVAFGLN